MVKSGHAGETSRSISDLWFIRGSVLEACDNTRNPRSAWPIQKQISNGSDLNEMKKVACDCWKRRANRQSRSCQYGIEKKVDVIS